jgi:hypothetical protein
MILRLLKGRGMVSGLIEKKRDAIPPHPVPPQALSLSNISLYSSGHDQNFHLDSLTVEGPDVSFCSGTARTH